MTAILAVPYERDGASRVLMAGDRALVNPSTGECFECGPKVVPIGRFVVGIAGAIGGIWNEIRFTDPPPRTMAELLALIGPGPDGCVLVAQGAQVSALNWDSAGRWSVDRVKLPTAIGSGGQAALGAYRALRSCGVETRKAVRQSMAQAAKLNAYVRAPFDLLVT